MKVEDNPTSQFLSGVTPQPRGIYSRILGCLRPYRLPFCGALGCMVLFGATDGGVPFLVKYVLDGVFSRQDEALLFVLPAVLISFAAVRAFCDFGQQYLMARCGHFIVRDLRNHLNRHILRLSPDYFVANSSADIISRATSDVMLVRSVLTESVAAIVRDSIRVLALVLAAIYLDPMLALIALLAFPLGIYPVYRFGRKVRRLSKTGQDAIGNLSSMLSESIIGNRVVRIFGRESYEEQSFAEENQRLTKTLIRSEKPRALSGPVNEILASVAISGVILYGGYSVIGGLRSQGEFIAFLIAAFLMYDPFKKLSRVHSIVQQGVAGAERIFEVLDTPPAITDPPQPLLLSPRNDICFENVTFSYPRRAHRGLAADGELEEQPALFDIHLSIPEGKKVALVGLSGAGKSTLVDLIPRFLQPQSGKVLLGGVDVATVRLADLRGRIAMVGQHTFLFNDTVYNNIAYGNAAATRQQVIDASRAAFAEKFIVRLPHGFETMIGEAGLTLSGGERQRIAIARALLKNAPILILDEATASLDNQSEREVQAALESLERGKTTVVIAHRLSTVRHADEVVVLKHGRIVERGTHDDLLKQEGEYAKLYLLQFREPEPGSSDGVIVN